MNESITAIKVRLSPKVVKCRDDARAVRPCASSARRRLSTLRSPLRRLCLPPRPNSILDSYSSLLVFSPLRHFAFYRAAFSQRAGCQRIYVKFKGILFISLMNARHVGPVCRTGGEGGRRGPYYEFNFLRHIRSLNLFLCLSFLHFWKVIRIYYNTVLDAAE